MKIPGSSRPSRTRAGRFAVLAFLPAVFITAAAIAETGSGLAEAAERFNPLSPVQGSGWARLYDPIHNELRILPYLSIDGMAIFEGDIILGSAKRFENGAAADSSLQQSAAIPFIGSRWQNGELPYVIDSGFSAAQLNNISNAMSHIETRTSIRFVNRSTQPDYVRIVKTGGCSSWVGRTGGEQMLTLGGGCSNSLGVIVHELYHALGMYHEQSRSDRDSFVTIHYANIQSGFEHNFDKAGNVIDTAIGPYDYNSIMHYGRFAFSSNGLETISTPNNESIGNRNALSNQDIHGMQYLYYTDLQLDISHPDEVAPGASVALGIDIANQGDNDIGDIIARELALVIPLPDQSIYRGFNSNQGWQCNQQQQQIQCNLAQLGRGASTGLTLDFTAPTGLNSMQLNPSVSASNRDVSTANNSTSGTITVTNLTDLAVSISAVRDIVPIGGRAGFELDLGNASQTDTGQVNLSLAVPASFNFAGFDGNGWACAHAQTTTTCQLGNLAAGASSRLRIDFDATAKLSNESIRATVTTQNSDGDPANNSASTRVSVSNPQTSSSVISGSGGGGSAIDSAILFLLCLLGPLKYRRRFRIKRLLRGVSLVPATLVLTACQSTASDSIRVLYVDSKTAECSGLVPQQCLRVRSSREATWENFYAPIEGFDYETGYRYKLMVRIETLDDPPQDGSSLRYKLIEVAEKNCSDC